jgi:hypothetical protein
MIADRSLDLERVVMGPSYHSREEIESNGYGFLTHQEAPTFLGMKQRAFDLLVAAYRDIFMRIMKDEKMWVIPEVYLKGLSQNEDFPLVKAKYELLASRAGQMRRMTRATPSIQPARKDRWRPGF